MGRGESRVKARRSLVLVVGDAHVMLPVGGWRSAFGHHGATSDDDFFIFMVAASIERDGQTDDR